MLLSWDTLISTLGVFLHTPLTSCGANLKLILVLSLLSFSKMIIKWQFMQHAFTPHPANRCLKIVLLRWLFIHCNRRHKSKARRCHLLLTHPSHSLHMLFINSDVTFFANMLIIEDFSVHSLAQQQAKSNNLRNKRKRGRSEKHRDVSGIIDRLLLDAVLMVVKTYVPIQRQLTGQVILLECTISCPAIFGYFSSISPLKLSSERRSICHFCRRIPC